MDSNSDIRERKRRTDKFTPLRQTIVFIIGSFVAGVIGDWGINIKNGVEAAARLPEIVAAGFAADSARDDSVKKTLHFVLDNQKFFNSYICILSAKTMVATQNCALNNAEALKHGN